MSGSSYFSHDANARNDSKVVRLRMKHGAAGYGVYFMILERLRDEQGYMSAADYEMLAFDFRVDAELVRSVVEDFGLFVLTDDGEQFYSDSFNRRMGQKDDIIAKRAEAGRKGVAIREQRKKQTEANASENGSKTDANASENGSKTDATQEAKQAFASESGSKTDANASENGSKTEANASGNGSNKRKGKERKYIKESSTPTTTPARACAQESEPPTADDEKAWHEQLTRSDLFVESAQMRFKLPRDEVLRALGDLALENAAKGKRHQDFGDYRSHAFDYIRIWAKNAPPAAAPAKGVGVMHIPTQAEVEADEQRKADEERQRVMDYYAKAKAGNARFKAIVDVMAKNGTLAKYGINEKWEMKN